MKFVETLRKSFDDRKQYGKAEERWMNLKEALVGSAEQHLALKKPCSKENVDYRWHT